MNARILATSLLAAAAWVGVGGAARADRLDQKLLEQAPKIVEALQSKGYHTVGVIRFRVKIGSHPESFTVGAINGNLATRLENALIIHAGSDEKTALGVIHDASKTALRHKVGNWYSDKGERENLFKINYPLAWGNKMVKPDAILTGLVEVNADYTKGTVTIDAFTAKETKLTPLMAKFTFEADAPLLHDLGKSYSVRGLRGKHTAGATRNVIFKEVKKRDEDNTPDKPTNNSSTMVGDIEFKLLSDGESVTIKAGADNNKQMQVECPDPSKAVVFSISNKGDKRLGVDLKLNGTSLLLRQAESSEACRLWVLMPGKTYTLKGYYEEASEKNVAPFQILIGDAAKSAREQLGDKAGEILINVFDESEMPAPGDEMLISRGIRGMRGKAARADLHSLQSSLMRGAALKRVVKNEGGKKRELIVEDTDETKRLTEALTAVDFKKGSSAIASQVIKVIPGAATNDKSNDKTNDKSNDKSNDKKNDKSNDKSNDK